MSTKWFTLLFAVSLAVFIINFGAIDEARACDPAPHCSMWASSEGSPACLVFGYREDWEWDDRVCDWYVEVRNGCDKAVEFSELNCDDDCLEPVVIEANSNARVEVRAAQDGALTQTFGWSLGATTGVAQVEAFHNPYNEDPCAESGWGCQNTSAPMSKWPIFAVLVGLAFWVCRRAAPASSSD